MGSDDIFKKRRADRKKRTHDFKTPKANSFLIITEGEKTEPCYFNGFKKMIEKNPIYRDMVLIHIENHVGETLYILNKAEKFVKRTGITNSHIWCVYDKDEYPAERFNQVEERIAKLNQKQKNGVLFHAAWSNQCIEFWFILHFAYYHSNTNREAYIKFIDEKFRKLGFKGYQKNMKDTFDIIRKYGREEDAIRNAKRIICENAGKKPSEIEPGTRVYEIVEELRKYI